jgi:hypothetical protein
MIAGGIGFRRAGKHTARTDREVNASKAASKALNSG